MAIDIGDAVLTFLGDTTQLDAAFDKVGTEVPAKLAPAEAAVGALGTKFETAGAQGTQAAGTLADAWKLLPPVIAQTDAELQNMAFALRNVAVAATAAGEETALAAVNGGEKIRILDEAIGIRLPRGVTRFISELIPLGGIMDAAFAASVIFIVVEALAKGVEKLIEWHEEAHKIELAQTDFNTAILNSFNTLDDNLLRAGIKVDELRGDHMAALNKEIELINHQSLDQLQHEFEVMAKAADALFKQLETEWFTFTLGSKGAADALKDLQSQYQFLLAQDKEKEANDLFEGTRKSAHEVLDLMRQLQAVRARPTSDSDDDLKTLQIFQLEQKLKDLNAIKVFGDTIDDKAVKSQEALVAILDAQIKKKEKINEFGSKEIEAKNIEEGNRAAGEADKVFKAQADAQKQAIDQEDKAEDDRRNHFIASMQEQEKERIAATKQGSEERIRVIDAAIKEEEAHGFQDEAYYKSLQVQRVQAVQARIVQQQKAEQDADKKELNDAEQQAKREVTAVQSSGKEQEKALDDLGKTKVLSQAQTSKRLIAVYEDEKNKTLAILNNLLHEEQALMEKSASQLSQAKNNPAATPEQIAQAEGMLAQLKNAVANTEAQIDKVKSDANARSLASDRSYYGQAVALAIAFGKQELAQRLQANHAALLSAQAQLADARARHLNTSAIQRQVNALQKLEKELIRDTAQQTKQHAVSLSQFAQLSKTLQAYEAELDRSGSKTAAWGASLGSVISAVAEAYAQGGVSMEQALARVAAAEIAAIAQVAEKEGAKQLALAFGSYPDAAGMAHHFASAGLWFALGGALSAGAGALSGGGGGSSKSTSSGGSAGPASNSPNLNSQQPSQVVNVTHLAGGGLATRPTFAVIGDSASGGSAREAVLPLDNNSAMKQIAQAIATQMKGGSTPVEIHFHGGIGELVTRINKGAQDGTIRVYATHSRNGTALSK